MDLHRAAYHRNTVLGIGAPAIHSAGATTEARGSTATSIAWHPGYAATDLQSTGVSMAGGSTFFRLLYKVTNVVLAQSAEQGAWSLVLAAADPNAEPGAYYGPTSMGGARGPVGVSAVADRARDEAVATALWEKTEALVGPFCT